MTSDLKADIDAIQKIGAVPKVLDVASRLTGMGFVAVARVTSDRWVCCAVRDTIQFGLEPGGELRVETTICNEIRQHGQTVVINDVATDGAFCNHLTPAIMRADQLRLLEKAAAQHRKLPKRPVDFHLKIDTGMNRLGIPPSEIPAFARALADCPHLRLAGTFTHIASSEVFTTEQTIEQEQSFDKALACMRSLGLDPGIVHMANSAAIVSRPSTWRDMVRPGAILYGYHPGYDPVEQRPEIEARLPLKPVLSLRTRIINIREIPEGAGVGYNETFIAKRPTRIAVLAAGYGDGIHRSLGNRGSVLVRGTLAPIVGIVSMDVTMIDVTDVPGVELGDVVTIYGSDGEHVRPANVIARSIGTVTSDLLCAVSQRVPRLYVK